MASEEVSTTMESERVPEDAENAEQDLDDDQVMVTARAPHVLDGKSFAPFQHQFIIVF